MEKMANQGGDMSADARAKVILKDGRQVWRDVRVRYREVDTGRWIAAEEAEALMGTTLMSLPLEESGPAANQILRKRLMEVQAQIALDKESGAKATSAARLVLNMLKDMEQEEDHPGDEKPWFVLGRELAKEVLAIIEGIESEI